MKSYPSFPYGSECHLPVVAFDKLDGSNVRAEWSKKKSWHKFGTRNHLIDASDPVFGKVPDLIVQKYGRDLVLVFEKLRYERVVCFFEFWGPNSFAGLHSRHDTQTVTLIDVAPYKQGILEPDKFIELFGHLEIPKVLYRGIVTPEFMASVRSGELEGMTFEGVVCKTANDKKTKAPIMFKQKNKAWSDKLLERCAGDIELYMKWM